MPAASPSPILARGPKLLAADACGVGAVSGKFSGDRDAVGVRTGVDEGESPVEGACTGAPDGESAPDGETEGASECMAGGEAAGGVTRGAGGGVETAGGEVAGGVTGGAGGGVETAADTVLTAIFMPPLQCSAVPQMKYLFPGDESFTTVFPSL